MSEALTLYEKLCAANTVRVPNGRLVLLYADLHVMNEYT